MENQNEQLYKQVQNLQKQVDDLTYIIESLASSTTIPFDIGEAFKKRLEGKKYSLSSSSKTVADFTRAVNEAGTATYNVSKLMTGFKTLQIGDTKITIATYD